MIGSRTVVVIGDANADLVIRLRAGRQQTPTPDLLLGGTAANTARGLRSLGVPVSLVGVVGDDGYGRDVRQQLTDLGIGTDYLTLHPEAATTLVLAILDAQGENTLLGWPRRKAAHTRLTAAQIDPRLIAEAAWLHTTGICLVESPSAEAVLHGLATARAAGVRTSLDLNLRLGLVDGRLPDDFRAILMQAIALADVVFGSAADELTHLYPGLDVGAAASQFAGSGRTAVVRLGAGGVCAVRADEIINVPAFPTTVASTVGAGDAFNAGYIAAAIKGLPLAEQLRWGNAAAALKIGPVGEISVAGMEGLLRGTITPPRRSGGDPPPTGRG